ncbi:nuclear factor of activated T-cells, cytoplasmic 3-like [Hippocampus zosterae]|uniref:nuclear factor of activated T-cells, cytoplasmic 3-like n=1 Tax=Hippocampus zosterae TaxID=109293 RepID=UPI00223CA260|nr:nuclear factor of activated T-cells, cytoplasmic 3-like [Hippocampus zosterae]
MSSAKCGEELEFGLIFEEDSRQNEGLRHHARMPPWPAEPAYGTPGSPQPLHCPSIHITAIGAADGNVDSGGRVRLGSEAAWSGDQLYLPDDPCYRDTPLCPSPCSSPSSRSWMSELSSCDSFSRAVDEDADGDVRNGALLLLPGSPGSGGGGGGEFGVELWRQKYQNGQKPARFSPTLSPYQSPQHSPGASVGEDTWIRRPHSRSTSPCGKRRHDDDADDFPRSPSPRRSPDVTAGASPRGNEMDDIWAGFLEPDVPTKTRKTSGTRPGAPVGYSPPEEASSDGAPPFGGPAERFLRVPAHFGWTAPEAGAAPLFRASSPPPLDFPLPSGFGPNRLSVEAEPRPYHRAHYETEGSRGAIKADDGGHPRVKLSGPCWRPPAILLLFMGTADERQPLRPHAFYQVHRVTGKTVRTTCREKTLDGTKVLEIPLTPDGDMTATIDCAGILKLRNADIELKKGETDAGRKNTRVRAAFRVAVPRSDGWTLWLQTSSRPIECSQRSGLDLPRVDGFTPGSCRREGGRPLVILGSNLSSRSRVIFLEKSSDGRVLWETDAATVPQTSSGSSLTVAIPAYQRETSVPVHVLFYVSNGKRRRSALQSFTYLPGEPPAAIFKREPTSAFRQTPGEPPWHRGWAQRLDVEREVEDTPPAAAAASLPELQELTLDDVNEIIGRDACSPSGAEPPQQSGRDSKCGDALFAFCGGPR